MRDILARISSEFSQLQSSQITPDDISRLQNLYNAFQKLSSLRGKLKTLLHHMLMIKISLQKLSLNMPKRYRIFYKLNLLIIQVSHQCIFNHLKLILNQSDGHIYIIHPELMEK